MGVIQVVFLPESCHHQVIFDDKIDGFPAGRVDLEAVEDRGGHLHAGLGVALDALALADVVQEQDQVKQGGAGGLVQLGAVGLGGRFGGREDGVELPDGAQGVDVRGVAVVILVLHQAGQRGELRHELPQHAQLMHQGQRGVNLAGLLEHGAEAQVGIEGGDDLFCDQLQRAADERGEIDVRRAAELLAVAEDADEADGVLLEDVRVLGGEFAATQEEAVEALGAVGAAGEEEVLERANDARAGGDGEREALLDDLGDAVNGLRVAVVVLHERLDALEQDLLRVAEVGGEAGLRLEVEHIRRMLAHVMELVAHAEQEVVAALEGAQLGRLQVVLLLQLVHARDAEADAGHPQGVLVVAQAADAVLDVGLLHEDGVAVLRAAAGLVGEARGDVALGVVGEVVLAVGLGEILVERLGARDEARLEQGRLGADVARGLGEDLVERAGGVADLELQVPERVEHAVGEMLLELRQVLHVRRVEEHHVHVAQRAELAAAVAAEGDEADGGGRLAVGLAPAVEGGGEERLEESVHAVGEGVGDLVARVAGAVALVDALALGREVGLAGGQTLRGRAFAGESGLEAGGGRGAAGHGRGQHEPRNPLGKSWKCPAGRPKRAIKISG